MSFWQTSDGKKATGEVQANNFDPVPKGTVPGIFESVEVDEYQGVRKIKLKTRVIDGEYKNKVMYMNLNAFPGEGVTDKKRDRAINLFMKICNVLRVKPPENEPDDRFLSQLTDKPLDVGVDVWEMNGKTGNYLTDVSARGEKAGASAPTPQRKPAPMMASGDPDIDIPF